MQSAAFVPLGAGRVSPAARVRGLATNTDGGTPSTRRNVRLKCEASANPAMCADSVTVRPPRMAVAARSIRSSKRYGRSGMPRDWVKTCISRDAERPTTLARCAREACCRSRSWRSRYRSTRLTHGCTWREKSACGEIHPVRTASSNTGVFQSLRTRRSAARSLGCELQGPLSGSPPG
jgi:hypothetical protein